MLYCHPDLGERRERKTIQDVYQVLTYLFLSVTDGGETAGRYKNAGWGRSGFTVVSTQNRVCTCIIIY